jgi:ABC-type transporter MlaC component
LRLIACASAVFCFGATLQSRAADPAAPHLTAAPVKRELAAVIEAQLAAFRANDYAKAYTFAATEIQGLFPVTQFETMVKQAYPVIAQSKTATFGLAFDTGDEAVVTVRVENASKTSVEYQYLLKKQNGEWKINGVSETKGGSLQV